MRDTDPIDPMWEADGRATGRAMGLAVAVVGGVARRLSPHLTRWAAGRQPGLVFGWGPTEYRLGRTGVLRRRRVGKGWEDNPRSNYNEAVRRKQERTAAQGVTEARAEAEAAVQERDEALARAEAAEARVAELETPEPALDLSVAAMQDEVASRMGMDAGSIGGGEVSKDPETLRNRLETLRSHLQALDDVADFDLVEQVDDELYQLHKAVEYKLRNHKASEAKSKLDGLFKS